MSKWLFLPMLAGKPWNGNTVLTEALGGSEAAVIYLASCLAARGHQVTVVTHGQPCTDPQGVTYLNQSQMDMVLEWDWDIVVSSRWPEVLTAPWKTATRALWLHDVGMEPFESHADHLVCISEYQRDFYNFEHEEVHVIGDGVDENLLKRITNGDRDENQLIWTSNPDRGTAVAASIFQVLRERWPDLELHIYGRASVYGWGPEAESPYLPRHVDLENVFLHEPLPRAQLFKVLAKSWAMFYPTYWPETFCMAALEAQAVGTPVITTPAGALPETVKGGIVTYDFLNAVSQLRNKKRWEKLSVQGIEWAKDNTWQKVAERWEAAIR